MDLGLLNAFSPMDRRHAFAAGESLPDRTYGAVLFADIAGFTPLTETLVNSFGPRRGAEEVTALLDAVYADLIAQVHSFGGSVISFSGDGFLCWFPSDSGVRACAAGEGMQEVMKTRGSLPVPGGVESLRLKATVAAGPVRRFLVGDPAVLSFDVLAGATVDHLMKAGERARPGDVTIHETAVRSAEGALSVVYIDDGVATLDRLSVRPEAARRLSSEAAMLPAPLTRRFVPGPVFDRIVAGQDAFIAELRPVVAMFVRCGGIDYDDDDDADVKLDGYVRWVQSIIGHYEGYLLQLTTGDKGTCLYAAFGALTAHEDDVERAVAAASDLLKPPEPLAFVRGGQIGVSRGSARVGTSGSRSRCTFAALGDEVNVAARLMQEAPKNGILCSGRVAHALEGRWAFEELPSLRVKGKEHLVRAYRPLGPAVTSRPTSGRRLVGRAAEVETLLRVHGEACRGQRRVMFLEGEPGIGKTRLVEELVAYASAHGSVCLQGSGHSIGHAIPFHAWREVLLSLLAPNGGSSRDALQSLVSEWIATHAPSVAGREPLLNDILHLGFPENDTTKGLDAKLRHESLISSVIELLRAASAQRPLMIILEDAHWLDSLSWDLALNTARALAGAPLLLVLTLRPMESPVPDRYAALLRLEGTSRLVLEGLPADETRQLAAVFLGLEHERLPADVVDLIGERGGGNPFFVEELVNAFREERSSEADCRIRVIAPERVPDTLEGVLLSRIDRLPADEQLTLKVASVIGRCFSVRTLRDVHPLDLDGEMLRSHLADCARRDLAHADTLEPEPIYRFKHAITQQVAYDTMLFAQRRDLHRRIAAWYEDAYSDDLTRYASLLAHHWSRAEHWERERRYARLAGEQAARVFANQEALRFINRAVELTSPDDLAGTYELLSTRVGIYDVLGTRETQAADIDSLRALAAALMDPAREAEAVLREADYRLAISDYAMAMDAAAQAIEHATRSGDAALGARCLLRKGTIHVRRAEWEVARVTLQRALDTSRPLGLLRVQAEALRSLGVVAWHVGEYTHAIAQATEAMMVSREGGDRMGESGALNNLGIVSFYLGNYADTLAYCDQAVRIAREIGNREGECGALNTIAAVHYARNEYAYARDCYERVQRIRMEIGDRWGDGHAVTSLGSIAGELGDYLAAQRYHEDALRIARELGDTQAETMRLSNLGVVMLHLGDLCGARSCLEQALQISRDGMHRQPEGVALANFGLVLHRVGEVDSALRCQDLASRIAEELGDRRLHAYALTRMGNDLVCSGRANEASGVFRKAIELRHDLGERALEVESIAGLVGALASLNRLEEARQRVEEILDHVDRSRGSRPSGHPLDGTDDPLAILLACHRVLKASQDPRAWDLVEEGYALLEERSARISDDSARLRYREGTPSHLEIIALHEGAGRQGGSPSGHSAPLPA